MVDSSKCRGALLSTGEKQMPFKPSERECLPAFLLTSGASHSDNNGEHWSLVNTVLCSVKSLQPLTTEKRINGNRNKTLLPFSPAVISDSCIRQLLLGGRINAKLKKFRWCKLNVFAICLRKNDAPEALLSAGICFTVCYIHNSSV